MTLEINWSQTIRVNLDERFIRKNISGAVINVNLIRETVSVVPLRKLMMEVGVPFSRTSLMISADTRNMNELWEPTPE